MFNYWGLVYIDFLNLVLYFNDGLKILVFILLLFIINYLLDLLMEMFLVNVIFKIKFWDGVLCF